MRLQSSTLNRRAGIGLRSALALLMAGCHAISVTSDYDSKTDFKKYKTFTIAADVNRQHIDRGDRDIILQAIDNEMHLRGYHRRDSADLLITIQSKSDADLLASASGTSKSAVYGDYNYSFESLSKPRSHKYPESTLFINVFDRRQKKIVWQGRGTEALHDKGSANEHEAKVNYAVNMIFQRYPIKSVRSR
jgi:hypothetical protein